MAISVSEPVGPALERTKEILFRPFDLSKWCALGFCAFLAQFAGAGGGGSGGLWNIPSHTWKPGSAEFERAVEWVKNNLTLAITLGSAVALAGCLLGMLIVWLGCRGQFMFIDGLVRNRGAVSEPWREYRKEANSLFWARLWLGAAGFTGFIIVAGLGAVIAWPDLVEWSFGWAAGEALLLGIPLLVVFASFMGCVTLCLADFVTPIMYARRLTVLPAFEVFWQSMFAGRFWTFVLYVLFRMLLTMLVVAVALVGVLCTCCIAVLPYVGTVILLPLPVFMRAYTLCFVQQFGPEWRFFPERPAPL